MTFDGVYGARVNELVGWRDHWTVRGFRGSNHGSRQDDQAWVGCQCMHEISIAAYRTACRPLLRPVNVSHNSMLGDLPFVSFFTI